jgi:hypothetical protein
MDWPLKLISAWEALSNGAAGLILTRSFEKMESSLKEECATIVIRVAYKGLVLISEMLSLLD